MTIFKTNNPAINITGNNNVVSNNQTGGQTAHTIINHAAPSRMLSANTANQLIQDLRTIGLHDLQIMFTASGGSEASEYAYQLTAIIAQSGWNVTSTMRWMDSEFKGLGVFISTEDANNIPEGADKLFKALIKNGISVSGQIASHLAQGSLQLVIGENRT